VFLDHDQRYTVSAGASYTYKETTVYADLQYGSGLRSGFANTRSPDQLAFAARAQALHFCSRPRDAPDGS
jgi:hypothetical protein